MRRRIRALLAHPAYVGQGGERRSFWLFFLGVSSILLIALVVFATFLLRGTFFAKTMS